MAYINSLKQLKALRNIGVQPAESKYNVLPGFLPENLQIALDNFGKKVMQTEEVRAIRTLEGIKSTGKSPVTFAEAARYLARKADTGYFVHELGLINTCLRDLGFTYEDKTQFYSEINEVVTFSDNFYSLSANQQVIFLLFFAEFLDTRE